jgi:hypothetical protein
VPLPAEAAPMQLPGPPVQAWQYGPGAW